MKRFAKYPLIAGLFLFAAACDDDSTPFAPDLNQDVVPGATEAETPPQGSMTIAETVVDQATNQGQFTALLDAVLAADPSVLETLSGKGQFTVFAPTDDAFVNALDGLGLTFGELAADQELLTEVLLYHVASGSRYASDVLESSQIRMLNGEFTNIEFDGSIATINGATIIATDIMAENGVIHVIDEVLLPSGEPRQGNKSEPSILDLVADDPGTFSILKAAVEAASPGIAEALDGKGQLTVFAPTDAAFEALLEAIGFTAEELLGATEVLDAVLLYHVTRGALFAEDVLSKSSIRMLDGNRVQVDGTSLNDDVNIVVEFTDIEARNGVVHVIDGVLLPPGLEL